MKQWYVDRVDETAEQTCRWCGAVLAWVEDVGWVDVSNGSYDMCDVDPYGNHQASVKRPPAGGARPGAGH